MGTPLRRTPALIDVLTVLRAAPGPVWGLWVVRETGRPTGSVYPILDRLERAGLAESAWDESQRSGPRRRMFTLTESGRMFAADALACRRTSRAVASTSVVTA